MIGRKQSAGLLRLLTGAGICALLATATTAGSASAKALCAPLAHCLASKRVCIVLQLPRRGGATILRSEAYADMTSLVDDVRRRRADVAMLNLSTDASSLLDGLRRSARARTVFIRSDGRAVEAPGLFLDDMTAVLQYLDGATTPPEGVATRAVRLRKTVCPKAGVRR